MAVRLARSEAHRLGHWWIDVRASAKIKAELIKKPLHAKSCSIMMRPFMSTSRQATSLMIGLHQPVFVNETKSASASTHVFSPTPFCSGEEVFDILLHHPGCEEHP